MNWKRTGKVSEGGSRFPFSNGHMALELLIQALHLTGEVITTSFTFASTTHAIVRNGLTPVFCDVNPEDYTMDVSKIEALITDKTSAIIPVHVYGNLCDVEAIEAIAKKHHLKVIYDAAHTFGVTYKGTRCGDVRGCVHVQLPRNEGVPHDRGRRCML